MAYIKPSILKPSLLKRKKFLGLHLQRKCVFKCVCFAEKNLENDVVNKQNVDQSSNVGKKKVNQGTDPKMEEKKPFEKARPNLTVMREKYFSKLDEKDKQDVLRIALKEGKKNGVAAYDRAFTKALVQKIRNMENPEPGPSVSYWTFFVLVLLGLVKAFWPPESKAGCLPSKPASVAQVAHYIDAEPPAQAETHFPVNYEDEIVPPAPTFTGKRYRAESDNIHLATNLKFQKQCSVVVRETTDVQDADILTDTEKSFLKRCNSAPGFLEGISVGNSHPIKGLKNEAQSTEARTTASSSTGNPGPKQAKTQANPECPSQGQGIAEGLSSHGAKVEKSTQPSRSRATSSSAHHETNRATTSSMGVQGWPTMNRTGLEQQNQGRPLTSRGQSLPAFPGDRATNLGNEIGNWLPSNLCAMPHEFHEFSKNLTHVGDQEVRLNFHVIRRVELPGILPQYGTIYTNQLKGSEKPFRFLTAADFESEDGTRTDLARSQMFNSVSKASETLNQSLDREANKFSFLDPTNPYVFYENLEPHLKGMLTSVAQGQEYVDFLIRRVESMVEYFVLEDATQTVSEIQGLVCQAFNYDTTRIDGRTNVELINMPAESVAIANHHIEAERHLPVQYQELRDQMRDFIWLQACSAHNVVTSAERAAVMNMSSRCVDLLRYSNADALAKEFLTNGVSSAINDSRFMMQGSLSPITIWNLVSNYKTGMSRSQPLVSLQQARMWISSQNWGGSFR